MSETLSDEGLNEIIAAGYWPGLMHDVASELLAARKKLAELEAALTPSPETEIAYMDEFSFETRQWDPERGEVSVETCVPWTMIKEIMAAIKAYASAPPSIPKGD